MNNSECIVCAQKNCNEERCQELLKAIEEIKIAEHSIEQLMKDLYP